VVATSLWAACLRSRGSLPGKNKRFFFSRHPDWFQDTPSPLFKGYQGLLPGGWSGQAMKLTPI